MPPPIAMKASRQRRERLDSYGVNCGSSDRLISNKTVVTTSTVIWVCAKSGADSPTNIMVTTKPTAPLIKTAFFACDPNWGRILAAVGRSGLKDLDLERVTIHLDEICIVRDGGRASDYTEAQGQDVMARSEISIRVELGRGEAVARIWTTDLSFDYVRINAEYRT